VVGPCLAGAVFLLACGLLVLRRLTRLGLNRVGNHKPEKQNDPDVAIIIMRDFFIFLSLRSARCQLGAVTDLIV